MNIQDAIDVIESVSGFTDESTPVGEAWAEVLSFIHRPTIQPEPEPEPPTDEEIDDWRNQCADLTRRGAADHYWAFDLQSDDVAGVVRAVLARWGTPANNTREEN